MAAAGRRRMTAGPARRHARQSPGSGTPQRWPRPISCRSSDRALVAMSSQYFTSGDLPGVSTPASDPFAIAVGGTTLGISQAGRRMFETGWSSGAWQVSGSGGWQRVGTFGAASGGASQLWRQPAYQKGVVPASLAMFGAGNQGRAARSVPDLSAVADDLTGFTVGMLTSTGGQPPVYTQFPVGGTSLATPPRGRDGRGGPAGPAPAVRVRQPGALPPGQDHRLLRHAAADLRQPGRLPRRLLPDQPLRCPGSRDVR